MGNTNTALSVYNFEAFPVRITDRDGSPWFVAKDVCSVLAIKQPVRAIEPLDEDEVSKIHVIDSIGRRQQTYIISESGLYALVIRSNKPEARKFRKWVTGEVLPAIRRNGQYQAVENALAAPEKVPLIETVAEMLRSLNERIIAKENIPAHILKYAWNLANVSRDVTMRGQALGLLSGNPVASNVELGAELERVFSETIDGAEELPGMPALDAEIDRVFLRSKAVLSVISENPKLGKNPMKTIRDLANDGFLERISKNITRYPHRQNTPILRSSGIMWNHTSSTPVRVLDINDGKIIEIEKD